ncbi:MAG: hypothetical protein Q8K50_10535 [Hydrogenophaga sp.]|nr:hypothetical protein [Hydrogenophaga sp.]MDP2094310.1 hypothetical protein [Hydrogenophaga sp.]
MILVVFKAMKRSITKAIPSTEQMMSGQIGQPAACMMENKTGLQGNAAIQ